MVSRESGRMRGPALSAKNNVLPLLRLAGALLALTESERKFCVPLVQTRFLRAGWRSPSSKTLSLPQRDPMSHKMRATWKVFLLSTLLTVTLAACTTTLTPNMALTARPEVAQRYAAPTNEKFDVDAVDTTEIDPKNLRQLVEYA